MYFESSLSLFQTPVEDRRIETTAEKPLILLWFWPYGQRFAFNSCRVYYNIDSCELTDDRSLYNKAQAVIFFHLHIEENATNLPKEPRPFFQRWIWLNLESPENTVKMPGLETIFNMTLNYRKDSDIVARNPLTIRDEILTEKIVLPDKKRTVCWIVSHSTPIFRTEIMNYPSILMLMFLVLLIQGSGWRLINITRSLLAVSFTCYLKTQTEITSQRRSTDPYLQEQFL